MFCRNFLSRALISLFIFNSLIVVSDVFASEKNGHFNKINDKKSKESNFLAFYPVLENYDDREKKRKEKIISDLESKLEKKGFELNIDSSKEDEYFNTEIKTCYPCIFRTYLNDHPLNVAKQLLENKEQDIRSWCGIYCNNNIFEKNEELFKEFNSFKPSIETKTIGGIYESILIYLYTISRFQNEICGSLYGFNNGFGLIKCLLDDFFENGTICGYNGKGKNDTCVVYRSTCIFLGVQGYLCIDMVYGYDKLKKFDLRFKIA